MMIYSLVRIVYMSKEKISSAPNKPMKFNISFYVSEPFRSWILVSIKRLSRLSEFCVIRFALSLPSGSRIPSGTRRRSERSGQGRTDPTA